MSSWWESAKQRHLVRWTLAYLAGAWLAVQALSILDDWYGLPGWFPHAALLLLLAGLSVTLILAWNHGHRGRQQLRRAEVGLLGLVTVATAIGVGAVAIGGPSPDDTRGSEKPSSGPEEQPTLAVLPFENLASPPDWAHFADGLSDELISVLGRIENIRVAGRSVSFRYRQRVVDLSEIARTLGVRYLVEGSVQIREGRLRTACRLLDGRTGLLVWTGQYERPLEDLLALQEEIARAIVNALGVQLLGDTARSLVTRYTEDLEAYREYTRGRSLQESGGGEEALLQSLAAFQAALEIDRAYALAWSGMADTYAQYLADTYWPPDSAYPLAGQAARRAVELDPGLGEARASLGGVLFWNGWNPQGALEQLNHASRLSPRYPRAHWIRGLVLHALGRYDEARAAMRRAADLDPSPYWQGWAENLHYSIRPPAVVLSRALDSLRAIASATPPNPLGLSNLPVAEYLAGNHDTFLRLVSEADQTAIEAARSTPNHRNAAIAVSLARVGREAEARGILSAWEALAADRYIARYFMAKVAANLDPAEFAFRWLDQAVADRDANLVVWLDVDPSFDPIREDPRFQALRRVTQLAR